MPNTDRTLRIGFLLIIMVIVQYVGLAQTPEFEFGKVPVDDLKMSNYPNDPEAEAVVLYDKGESVYLQNKQNGGFNVIFKRTKRIKILTKEGLQLANVRINYRHRVDGRDHFVTEIKANSFNLVNGQIQKNELVKSDIFDEKATDTYRSKVFAIPNVKEGTVIEYQYFIEFQGTVSLPDWEFQSELPTRYSEYQVSMIPFYEFTYLLQGRNRFDFTDSRKTESTSMYAGFNYQDIVYRFAMKDLPAFRDHSFITSPNDYVVKMDWQLATIRYPRGGVEEFLTTWPELSNSLIKYEDYGKFISSSERSYKKLASDIEKGQQLSPLEKAKAITEYVKTNFRWNGLYRKYTEKSVKKFLTQKTGSTAEINLFLIGLLRGAGLDANPVLISTRGNGKIKDDYPFQSFFNSSVVLVQANNQYFLTEGTEANLPFGLLPPDCINEKGLIITKDSNSWIDLNRTEPSSIQEDLRLVINPENGSVMGQFKKTMTLYDALMYRKNPSLIYKELEAGYELSGDVTESYADDLSPYVLSYKASTNLDVLGDRIYLKPFLNKPLESTPLKAKTRPYPVDFIYTKKRIYSSSIQVPDGFKVSELPKSLQIDDGILKLDYVCNQTGNIISTKASYTVKKAVFPPKEYQKLREHYSTLVDKLNEQIILEKN